MDKILCSTKKKKLSPNGQRFNGCPTIKNSALTHQHTPQKKSFRIFMAKWRISTLKPAKISSERFSTGEAFDMDPRFEAQKASKKSGCLRCEDGDRWSLVGDNGENMLFSACCLFNRWTMLMLMLRIIISIKLIHISTYKCVPQMCHQCLFQTRPKTRIVGLATLSASGFSSQAAHNACGLQALQGNAGKWYRRSTQHQP